MRRIIQHFIPGIDRPDPGVRNPKGEWRPDYPCRYAPVFIWPPRPIAFLKWLVTWPGFMWPRNLVLLAISAVSWLWFQPELARCAKFEWDWIGQLFLRNQILIWLVYGSYHLYFHIIKGEGTKGKYDARWPAENSKLFLFRNQVHDNVFWTCVVGCSLMTGYETVTMWLYANDWLPYAGWSEHPVWFVVWLFLIPFWREFHFYWIHRLIHWKPLYKRVHYLHHRYFECNYGEVGIPLDKWFGTFRDGLPDGEGSKLKEEHKS